MISKDFHTDDPTSHWIATQNILHTARLKQHSYDILLTLWNNKTVKDDSWDDNSTIHSATYDNRLPKKCTMHNEIDAKITHLTNLQVTKSMIK